MYQSVYYCICQIPVSKTLTSDDDLFEPFFDKDNFNTEISIKADENQELNLQSLIEIVEPDDILKI